MGLLCVGIPIKYLEIAFYLLKELQKVITIPHELERACDCKSGKWPRIKTHVVASALIQEVLVDLLG